jgi:coenzyme F420-reducing hydrogenase gamma subunit
MSVSKPRVAFFDFACCEGCQLTVLSIGEPIIDLLKHVDVVTWREAMSEKSDQYDIAVIEGSIARDSDVPRLKKIRERAKLVVALGSCACLGGPHVSANRFDKSELLKMQYGDKVEWFAEQEAGEVRPIGAEITVDVPIYGCPINANEFVSVMKHLLLGRPYRVPNEAVCYECKLNGYECVFDKGMVCLGPVTRCGCNAICTSRGHRCFGCRGLVDDPNVNAARDVLEEHGYTIEDVLTAFNIYSQRAPRVKELAEAAADTAKKSKGSEPWRFGSST